MASTRLGREPHMLEGLYPSLPGSLSPGWDPPHPRSGNSHSRPQAELGRGSQALPRALASQMRTHPNLSPTDPIRHHSPGGESRSPLPACLLSPGPAVLTASGCRVRAGPLVDSHGGRAFLGLGR